MPYITPSIEDISKNKHSSTEVGYDRTRTYIKIDEISKERFSFVLAMPGMGKSRLLKQIVKQSSEIFQGSLYIEAKYLNGKDYEKAINKILARPPGDLLSEQELVAKKNSFFEKPFELKKDSAFLVCLDALDEVGFDNIGHHAEQLDELRYNYPKAHIIVSCRDYIHKRIQDRFSDIPVKLFQLNPFNRFSAEEFLRESGFDDESISKVLQKFSTGVVQLRVIDSPRMLECFILYKNKQGIEKALETGLPELFDFFIVESLRIEDKKNSKSDAEIKYTLLRMLALCMNIYGKTEIAKDDVVTFLDSVKSNIAISYISKANIEDLYDRALLIPNENSVQFFNTEIQEFLASKEVIHLGKASQILFDVAYDSNLNEFKPFWKNTIKFIIEQEISVQSDLIDFMLRRFSSLDYSLLQLVLCDNTWTINSISGNTKDATFKSILKYYCDNQWLLGYYFAEKLRLYYTSSNSTFLEKLWNDGKKDKIILSNLLAIIHFLILNKKLDEENKWKNRLERLALSSFDFSVKEQAITALAHFKDLKGYISLYKKIKPTHRDLTSSFLQGLDRIDPNNSKVIDLILEALIKFHGDLRGIGLGNISTEQGYQYFLGKLSKDPSLFNKLDQGYSSYLSDSLPERLKKFWTKKISVAISNLIRTFEYYSSSKLAEDIIKAWKLNEPDSIRKIAQWYLEDWKKGKKLNYEYFTLLKDEITIENAEEIAIILSPISGSDSWASSLFFQYRHSNIDGAKEILEIGKRYFPSDWNSLQEKLDQPQEWEIIHAKETLLKLLKMLNPEEGKWYPEIFQFYFRERRVIESKFNEGDLKLIQESIKKLLNEKVLNRNFLLAKVKYEDGTISYSNFITYFSSAIPLFKYFNYKKIDYRSKLLDFLPFCFMPDERKHVFELLEDLSNEDKNRISKFYQTKREDDLFKKNLDALWDIVDHYKMIEALPLIKNFVFSKDLEIGDRLRALQTVNEFGYDDKFLKRVFITYSESESDELQLAKEANSFLVVIRTSEQKEAIKWRMQILFQKAMEDKSIDEIDHWRLRDAERTLMQILTPLSSVRDPEFLDLYLDTIKDAIEIYKRDSKFQVFAFTVWESLLQYFHNLALDGHRKPIESLRNFLRETEEFHGYKRLENSIGRVIYALLENDKSKKFPQCIHTYNELKSTSYLPIASDKDLQIIIASIVHQEIREWVEGEGGLALIRKLSRKEDMIQKQFKVQIENALLRRGLRKMDIIREPELLNSHKPDLTISYGFIGKVMIEIKPTYNSEASPKNVKTYYRKKLLDYMNGTRSTSAIFLLFQVDSKDRKLKSILPKLKKIFGIDYPRILVEGLNCVTSNNE